MGKKHNVDCGFIDSFRQSYKLLQITARDIKNAKEWFPKYKRMSKNEQREFIEMAYEAIGFGISNKTYLKYMRDLGYKGNLYMIGKRYDW